MLDFHVEDVQGFASMFWSASDISGLRPQIGQHSLHDWILRLPSTLMFDYPNTNAIAAFAAEQLFLLNEEDAEKASASAASAAASSQEKAFPSTHRHFDIQAATQQRLRYAALIASAFRRPSFSAKAAKPRYVYSPLAPSKKLTIEMQVSATACRSWRGCNSADNGGNLDLQHLPTQKVLSDGTSSTCTQRPQETGYAVFQMAVQSAQPPVATLAAGDFCLQAGSEERGDHPVKNTFIHYDDQIVGAGFKRSKSCPDMQSLEDRTTVMVDAPFLGVGAAVHMEELMNAIGIEDPAFREPNQAEDRRGGGSRVQAQEPLGTGSMISVMWSILRVKKWF
eukprot:s2682_g17.t1